MPAPDFQTIFDVETAMETAVDTILAAAPYNFVTVRSQGQQGKRVYPRADVQFSLGSEETHRGEYSPGQFINDAWLGVLTVTIGTKRGDGSHGQMRGLARLAMQYFKDEFNSSRLPYHVLTRIKHGNTECGISADNGTDVSGMNFECVVSVRAGAWPGKVATPVFTPNGGSGSTFTLATSTSGALIYYTTDDSTPDASSTLYAGEVTLDQSAVVKAIAIKAGAPDSDIAQAEFSF